MTGGPLFVQTDGLRQFSQTHAEIAAGVSQLVGGAPTVAGVEASHGQIAFAVQNALTGLLGARQGTLQTTARSGDKIAELLQKAAAAYDKGDERSAGKLKAAIEGAGGPGGPASGGGGANTAAGATGAIGQALGQLGQMGQQGSGAVQGLVQGLQQVPQQVMQGVQQIVQAATGAAGAGESERAPVEQNRDGGPGAPTPTQQV
ncbi:ESX-1 secretion-associated protein [Mycolicibacterium monacense]|uniref:ESX-1 secretion-associated protein n=1 Tax=Mycolicibacterium monacense TaxID=85693 RepID=UPI0007EC2C18|nr:ESX-1 secretion-associated protein [Mycolicibacterium monacense]OBB56382.1 hypothetical protein A6B34_06720 [Mycolicibacterium monacense]OBF54443.1 hypothetical protein A5778_10205 [Mycolicibacterium monacense]